MTPVKKLVLIAGVISLVVIVPVVKHSVGSSNAKSVTVEALGKRIIRASTLASGALTHEDKALIRTEIIGRVTSVLVEEGEWVTKDQLLLQIDDTRFSAEVEQYQALKKMREIELQGKELKVKHLQKSWARNEHLFDKQVLNEYSFEDMTLNLELAITDLNAGYEALHQVKAQLAQAEDYLKKTQIRSPFKGLVTSLDIKEGEMAISSNANIPGSSLMTIAKPASMHSEVFVDEADITDIAIGQEAEVYAIAYPETPIKGVVEFIAASAKVPPGRQSLSFAVKIGFPDEVNLALKPGMSSRAEIFTNEHEKVYAVPIQAVLSRTHEDGETTQYYIYVEDNLKAKKIDITACVADDDYQQIDGDLTDSLNIITGPDRVLRNLNEGDKLSIEITE